MNLNYSSLLDLICIIIILTIIFAYFNLNRIYIIQDKYFLSLLICVLAIFVIDIPGILLDGNTVACTRYIIWILDTVYWLLISIYGALWILFEYTYLYGSSKKVGNIFFLPTIIEIVLILTNPLTGWIFIIDEKNRYCIGSFYYYNFIPYIFYILLSFHIFYSFYITQKDKEKKQICLQLLAFMVLPFCGILLELTAYGINWLWPLITLSLIMIFFSIQQRHMIDEQMKTLEERERNSEIEKQLISIRIKIMLSQIQPHFLYNSLAIMQALCVTSPEKAVIAMEDFNDFLRGNMNSLKMTEPISFEKELEHTNHYLSLEKLRFGDLVNINYDIKTTDFCLPTLTLQPIVENSVRYGIRKTENGGTVKISTNETEESYIVVVEDDGVGFDIMETKDDGRTHIGITNVKNRIESMCDGTLSIKSILGVGTTAVITIPKGGGKKNE